MTCSATDVHGVVDLESDECLDGSEPQDEADQIEPWEAEPDDRAADLACSLYERDMDARASQ